jgi:hypothetical protein
LKGIIADTGLLYAAYDPSDRYHNPAIDEVQRLETEDLVAIVLYPVFL